MISNTKKYEKAIFTPFYPIYHRKDLFEDTYVVNYLVKAFPKKSNTTIIHTYMHPFRNAWNLARKVWPIDDDFKKHLYRDNFNNNILFFEYLFLFPKSMYTFKYFDKAYARMVETYYKEKLVTPQIYIFHLPSYYIGLIEELEKTYPNTKKIAIIHSFDIKNIKKRKKINFWKKYYSKFDRIGFRSIIIKKEFESLMGPVENNFICLSGIPESYANKNVNKRFYDKSSNIKFIYAGRLNKNKNVEQSIKSINESTNNFSFNIIGEGEEKEHLRKMVNNMKIMEKVNFKGMLNRDETFRYMTEADIFIMVSKKETLGLVYIEAMAAGCIVIGTKGQGIDGVIIDGENGFLVDSNNPDEISQTISKVINLNFDDQKKIRNNAKNTVKSLTDNNVSLQYYSDICAVIPKEKL